MPNRHAARHGAARATTDHLDRDTYRASLAAAKLCHLRGNPPRSWETAERILAMNAAGLGQKAIRCRHAQAWECQNPLCNWITEPLDAATAPSKCANCGSIQIRPVDAALHYMGHGTGRSSYTAADFALDFHSWAATVTQDAGIAAVIDAWAAVGCAECQGGVPWCKVFMVMGGVTGWDAARVCEAMDELQKAWHG